ncbi:Pentatricopeptide repeat-containing protein, mitochondrial [Vitis vinifera]|uniref:Pentatricopeptide repeat-containing protein, mitochondrial n=1 Tax=Vitis vinifera TaxID=29760 RepID=A0A438JN66_VITVI|nr:Pentatricopeptide repeat-containing protein, mitochondrial [Vitis vinifera]
MWLLKSKWKSFSLQSINTQNPRCLLLTLFSTMPLGPSPVLRELCNVVSNGVGSLDDLEASLDRLDASFTSSLISQILDTCKNEAPTRRLLRFFLWSSKKFNCKLEDGDFNYAIQVFAEKKDLKAIDILVSDLSNEGREMKAQTFGIVAETLVSLGREDDALGLFKNLEKFKCSYDSVTVTAIVNALCSKGHARRAEGVVRHHKDKILGVSLAFIGVFSTDGLVPEALNVMMEMRSNRITPTSISYNILLSCLGRTRRVKESCRILDLMKRLGCSPDWVSYYLVARVLYLTGRFGKGNQIVDEMIEEGLVPDRKFYYDLIGVLCGVERVNYALEMFERMKRSSLGGYGPVYDVLIPKLCRSGDFGKGRELWDEATRVGVLLHCSSEVLDPSITKVFKPARKDEEVCTMSRTLVQEAKAVRNGNKNKKNKNKKKSAAPS